MKTVLISINPRWGEKIASGKKTIEVRKTAPKEVPFKAYIYCSYGNDKENYMLGWRGKVIGEFICDKLTHMQAYRDKNKVLHLTNIDSDTLQKTCLKSYELFDYISNRDTHTNVTYNGNLWHISDLKIYDKPKELSEFCMRKL